MLKSYKGFKIKQEKDGRFYIYTNDEWSYGKGLRYSEHDACTLEEAKEFIDSY